MALGLGICLGSSKSSHLFIDHNLSEKSVNRVCSFYQITGYMDKMDKLLVADLGLTLRYGLLS